jgi:ATP dependent DNA ligase domain.
MIKPMLAYKVDQKPIDWTTKVYLQPKLDGVRCIFTKDGAYSRAGNEFKNVAHIKYDLTDFFRKHPNAVLDGELYNHALKDNFEKIISLVRKQNQLTRTRVTQRVLYNIMCMIL